MILPPAFSHGKLFNLDYVGVSSETILQRKIMQRKMLDKMADPKNSSSDDVVKDEPSLMDELAAEIPNSSINAGGLTASNKGTFVLKIKFNFSIK